MGGRSHCCGVGTDFEARRWLSLDLCGCLGISLSWGVHLYALVVIAIKLLSHSLVNTVLFFAFYVPIALLAMLSLFMAWTSDPGAVPMGARPLTIVRRASSLSGDNNMSVSSHHRRGMRRCHKCNDNYKPPRAHHDSVTGRCVVKFDHFCPWVGNAVGALNHKFFCLFLLYTMLTCLLSLMMLLIRVVHCGYVIEEEEAKEPKQLGNTETGQIRYGNDSDRRLETQYLYEECNDFYGSHWILGLVVASLVFLVFTCSMGCEQLEAIETGKGKIARMKMRVGQAGTEFSRVTEEFNEMFGGESPKASYHWFLPFQVQFPRGMKKVVLGYEWDESFERTPYQEDSESGSDRELDDMEVGKPAGALPLEIDPPARDPLMRSTSETSMTENGVYNRKESRSSDEPTLADRTLPRLT